MKTVKMWAVGLMVLMLLGMMMGVLATPGDYNHFAEVRADDTETIHGTFVINQNTTDPLTGEKGKYGFDSSVVVASDGVLIVENATLYFLSDIAHPRSLTVYGSLILYNATVTLGSNQIQPYYHMNVTINGTLNPSARVSIVESKILYDGWFKVENKNTNIVLKDTVFDRMPGSSSTYGPTPVFENSILQMENCSFNNLFEHPSTGTVYIGNMVDSTGTTATNTNSGTLTHFTSNPDPQYGTYWDKVPVKEIQITVQYNTTADYDNSSELRFIYRDAVLMKIPLSLSTTQTNATLINESFSSADLKASDIENYISSGIIRIEVSEVHFSGEVYVQNVEMRFLIEQNVITYGIERFDFNLINSVVYAKDLHVDADFELDYGTTHNRITLYDNSKLYVLNLTVVDTTPKADSCIYASDSASQVYLFRYAKIRVMFNSIPLSGLYVNITPYLINTTLRNEVITETQNFIDHMMFGNYTGSTFWAITDDDGYAYLPMMSDIVNRDEWPNSRYVGIYNMWVNKSGESYYEAQIAVDHFPNLMVENNTFEYHAMLSYYKHVDVGVEMQIVTPKPYITGNNVDVLLNVTNFGTELADNINVYLYLNGNIVDYDQIYSLNPSETTQLHMTIPGSALSLDGTYNITAEVIQKWDTNKDNNVTTTVIKVGRIAVSSWDVDLLINGHTANITANVYSYYEITGTNVILYLDSTPLKTWNVLYSGDNSLTYRWNVNGTAGNKTLYIYVNSTLIGEYQVYVYRDVDVGINSIHIYPAEVFVSQEITISINVTNYGADVPQSTYLDVKVYDPYNNLAREDSISVDVIGTHEYSLVFVPTVSGLYRVEVTVAGGEDYNPSNNYLSMPFEVRPTPYDVTPNGDYVYVNGTTVRIEVTIASAVDSSIKVYLYLQPLNMTIAPSNFNNPVDIPKNGRIMAQFNIEQTTYEELLRGHSITSVLYFIKIESNKTQTNNTFGPFYFTLKEKADFQVVPGSLVIMEENRIVNNLHVAEGVIVQIKFMIRNIGGIPENATYTIMDGNTSLEINTVNLGVGSTYNVTYNYTIYGVGSHTILVTVNPHHNISERSYSNNNATANVEVIPPLMDITYTVSSQEHGDKIYEGDHVVVIVKVINHNATESQQKNVYMSNVRVTVNFGALGTYNAVTNAYGVARIEFVAKRTGSYTPTITAQYHGVSQAVTGSSYAIQEKPLMERIPWLWVIVGVIALAIGLFFLYGYLSFKKEAKEYMICGNCGHLIPADAEKCPYCGAVFEKEKVKCPDCGSWIDEDSKFCPVCGSVFMTPEDAEYDKYVALKERYDQYLAKYKEEATKYIGESYTQEEFFKWWKTHPEFISFLEWVKRQEEEIEGETVRCEVCGALNPKGAKICRVCGSPLPTPEEEEKEKKDNTEEHTVESGTTEEDILMKQYKEEYEKLQHPGVVSFEEWVKRKKAEKEQTEEKSEVKESKESAATSETAAKPNKETEKPVEEKVKEGYIKCPVCGALNKPDAKVCAVCGSPLEKKGSEKPAEEKTAPAKPVVKKKVIKKVIPVKEEEKK